MAAAREAFITRVAPPPLVRRGSSGPVVPGLPGGHLKLAWTLPRRQPPHRTP